MRLDAPTDQDDAYTATEARRRQRIRIAQRAGWPELERRHLAFERFGTVTDERDGTQYRINRGEIDAQYNPISAYFVDRFGDPVVLEKRARR